MSNIFLVGFMGSGKTTLGKKLSEELSMDFIDSDNWISKLEGKTIPEIFDQHGEAYFREKETEFISYAASLKNTIISTGAGLPCMNDQMQRMNQMGKTVWLDVDEDILVERIKNDATPRPKLNGFATIEEAVHSLLEIRRKFYELAILKIKNPTTEILLQIVKQII